MITRTILCLTLLTATISASSQKTYVIDSTGPGFRTVIPGKQYGRSNFHQFFWGKHYRKEWTTPVSVPVIDLATVKGGLTPVEQGGGRQTKTLRLQDAKGKQYVLRSIDKTYTGALPPIMAGSFVEDILNDQVSSAHPFAAITIPGMISATGIYHTVPEIVFVPYSTTLGQFNEVFGNTLCLFEERPDEDQSTAPNFGFSKNVIGTPKLLENVREENDHLVDQSAYIKARLFDVFIGDWGRHEDQWRWARFDSAGYKVYKPVPRDRDQTYTLFDGVLVNFGSSLADLDHLQSFDFTIDDIDTYNYPARNLDRRFANAADKNTWLQAAKDLQEVLTDSVIQVNVKKMPAEMFALSGEKIMGKLARRRNDLVQNAEDYYRFIARRVDVVGSEQNELFRVTRLDKDHTKVEVYALEKTGVAAVSPFYSRVFNEEDTKEIRLYGLKGNDKYEIEGPGKSILVRVIGGIDADTLRSTASGRLHYYDNPGNIVEGSIRQHLSSDTTINGYTYNSFRYNSGGMVILPWYNNRRGVFFNLGYKFEKQQWRKFPYGWKQRLTGYYSIFNNSFGADYEGHFVELLGKWDLLLNGSYDQKLDNYFLGIGNETEFNGDKPFYKLFTQEANFSAEVARKLGKFHTLGFRMAYDMVQVKNENEKTLFSDFLAGTLSHLYNKQHFAGAGLNYEFMSFNDPVLPTKGFRFVAAVQHTQNVQLSKKFQRYSGMTVFYLPFSKRISLASRAGLSHIEGEPEIYQLNTLGGGQTLRGYFRQRFYGTTSYFNNNDLRYIFNVRGKLFNGQMGLVAFADNGRVWNEGESSNKIHWGYGGGVMIVPFNKIVITAYYGKGEDLSKFHFRVGRFF